MKLANTLDIWWYFILKLILIKKLYDPKNNRCKVTNHVNTDFKQKFQTELSLGVVKKNNTMRKLRNTQEITVAQL